MNGPAPPPRPAVAAPFAQPRAARGSLGGRLIERLDSLFARLMLAQLVLVLLGMALAAAFMISERNVTLAPYRAEVWAPAMQQAARRPPGGAAVPALGLPSGLLRARQGPAGFTLPASRLPGFRSLGQELLPRGVTVLQACISLEGDELIPTYWIQIRRPPGVPVLPGEDASGL
jgi:two-component system osmolarity sensor histidine kinase EnvZ